MEKIIDGKRYDTETADKIASSPAEHAGMRTGDEVLGVDGRDIAAWDLPQISDLFDDGEPGRKVPVRVVRGGQERKLTLKLAEVVR